MKKLLLNLWIVFIAFTAESQSWLLEGNSGTNPKIHYIGTKDQTSLFFRINNTFSGILDSSNGQTFFGYKAGNGMANGKNNVAIGYKSLSANVSGHHSTSIGVQALTANSTGHENVASGYSALYYNTTGSYNTATGNITLFANTTGNGNTAHGFGALSQSTGSNNTATGYEALYYNQGTENVAMGNVSNFLNYAGSYNTSVGSGSLMQNNSSYYNTALGYNAGRMNQMGWNNTLVGANCDVNLNDRYNCTAIGQSATCTANSQARIGNSATSSIGGYANWTNISDGRYKKDITQNVKGLDFILKLQPVTYHLDISGLSKKLNENRGKQKDEFMDKAIKEKETILFSGFVAQDVEKAAKEAGYEFSGVDKPKDDNDLYGLRYAEFVVPLVKGMQEQQLMLQEQKDIINSLVAQNTLLQKRIENIEKKQGAISVTSETISVWPNPSSGKVFINISSSQPCKGQITLIDSKGSIVKLEQINLSIGENKFVTDIKGLAKGLYHIAAEWNKGQMKSSAEVIRQ